jgi:nitrous oxidase accessory protein
MTRGTVIRILSGATAAALVWLSSVLPLWTMTMRAPQYPKGLRLTAYGTGMAGDLRELNILNHYIGMPPIEAPQLETALFPIGIALLVALCLLSPLHRWLRSAAIAATVATPIMILLDLQWRLYTFGHSMDPHAPIRLKPFTPLVLGTSQMGNFVSSGAISSGVFVVFIAAVVLVAGGRLGRRQERRPAPASANCGAIAAVLSLMVASAILPDAAHGATLQERLAAAKPGATVTVDGGVHQGPIVVQGPLVVIGERGATIDGGGKGSVVTITGDRVVFRGFVVRNSGRQVTEEAAGIKATGNGHRIEHNVVRDVYFGIHAEAGSGYVIQNNEVVPGERHGARPGHGISIWNARDSQIVGNRIADARDGIYLSFTEGVVASGNQVTRCRYGIHSMYSQDAAIVDNRLVANLLGSALMMSDRLVLRGNRIEQHRQGAAAYGVLLKDIGDLLAEDNIIVGNRIGVYAEGVATIASRTARLSRNVIAGNEVGLAMQSNAALTLTDNQLADNLTDVRPLGRHISDRARWSADGRGNFWSQYRGYDADRDGIGDVPHRVDDVMDALMRRSPAAQAFLYTPAHLALEAAARMFPLFIQPPVVVDDHPLMAAASRRTQ